MVGEDVVSETVRCALLEIGLRLKDSKSGDGSEKHNLSGVVGWDLIVLLILCHDC